MTLKNLYIFYIFTYVLKCLVVSLSSISHLSAISSELFNIFLTLLLVSFYIHSLDILFDFQSFVISIVIISKSVSHAYLQLLNFTTSILYRVAAILKFLQFLKHFIYPHLWAFINIIFLESSKNTPLPPVYLIQLECILHTSLYITSSGARYLR